MVDKEEEDTAAAVAAGELVGWAHFGGRWKATGLFLLNSSSRSHMHVCFLASRFVRRGYGGGGGYNGGGGGGYGGGGGGTFGAQ